MAVPTDAERRTFISESISSDLQYVWADCEVSLTSQYALGQHYRTLKVFGMIADTKAEVRTALRTDFALQCSTLVDNVLSRYTCE